MLHLCSFHPSTYPSFKYFGETYYIEPASHREDTDKDLALTHVIFSVQATQISVERLVQPFPLTQSCCVLGPSPFPGILLWLLLFA